VLQTLGAGHVPNEYSPYSLEPLVRRAVREDIPVLLTSPYQLLPQNLVKYSPARAAQELGALQMGNLTLSALLTKLSWALGIADVDGYRSTRRTFVAEMLSVERVGEGQSNLVKNL
jgi:L-asparaginase/Glu-tRNA(Gln) amidotransferase subunit D